MDDSVWLKPLFVVALIGMGIAILGSALWVRGMLQQELDERMSLAMMLGGFVAFAVFGVLWLVLK